MRSFAVLLLLLAATGASHSQDDKRRYERFRRDSPQMSREERERLREDMRDAYRDRGRAERHREMSREERDKLRQDIEDANRRMRR
jgi:hypothetical protein